MLTHGTLEEKLRWVFGLYDVDGTEVISRENLTTIVKAIYDMMGDYSIPPVDQYTVEHHVDSILNQV